jgi:sugar transferase (PEP-CTERM/EpsH1 system associated)
MSAMARARLLYLTPRFPWPVDRGDCLRAYHVVREFSSRADVTLASFTPGSVDRAPVERLRPFCSRIEIVSLSPARSKLNMVAAIPSGTPFQVAYFSSGAMMRVVKRLCRDGYDAVFAHYFRMAPYVEPFAGTRVFMDLQDSLSMNLARAVPIKPFHAKPAFRMERDRVERYERRCLERAEETWVISEVDRRDFARRLPGARVSVVPNGIDRRWGTAGFGGPKEASALFLGNLTVGHNVDAARYLAVEIWPRVRKEVPDGTLHLVGRYNRTVAKLASLPGIRLWGYVEDLTPLLASCRLTVAPLRYGAGVQNKVLETMAAGLPAVVTTMVGDPVGAEPEKEILTADDTAGLAGQIVRVLRDGDLARRIGEAGSRRVIADHGWDRAGKRLAELLG